MNLIDIANARLVSQQIAGTKLKTAKDIVAWMGAMQAQDANMVKWAIGIRLPEATEKTITTALDQGEIIRTHLLRPTWHLVAADNIYWMLALTAPQIKPTLKLRSKELELTEAVFKKGNAVIEKALAKGTHLTREELFAALTKAKIAVDNDRGSHLLFRAELDGISCSGAARGKTTTYALLRERVPATKEISREEALAKLARIYFTSHCPATLQDFTWWSRLSITDAKHALEMVKQDFVTEKINDQTYWLPGSFSIPKKEKGSVYLLPAFDEFIISYKDRSAVLSLEEHKKAVSNNGIFWPVIVIDGKVTGTWKRSIKKDKTVLETQLFQSPDKKTKDLIEKAALAYSHFIHQKTEIIHT